VRALLRRWRREAVLVFAVLCAALFTEPRWGERAAVGILLLGAFGVGLRALLGGGAPVQETLPAELLDPDADTVH
jgi:hypothetical protein